jgi:hypothetical protein
MDSSNEGHLWRLLPLKRFDVEVLNINIDCHVTPIYELGNPYPKFVKGKSSASGTFRALTDIDTYNSVPFDLICFRYGGRQDLKNLILCDDSGYPVRSWPIKTGQTVYFINASIKEQG